MKYIPLSNNPNVSRTKFDSVNPSLKIDDRGHPHIVWTENKLNQNQIHYSYWDGLQWTSWGINSIIDISEEEINVSHNSLVFTDDFDPIIVSSKKNETNGSTLSLLQKSSILGKWNANELDVPYNSEWIGIIKKTGILPEFSSSSSSSFGLSSSSSSIDSSSSSSSSSIDSSSSSSLDLSSSSSSIDSSSSSSIDSSSSSSLELSSSSSLELSSSSSSDSSQLESSSSEDDAIFFVATYDETNDRVRVYGVTDAIWRELGSIDETILDPSSIKIATCGDHLGVAYIGVTSIFSNFFHLNQKLWSYASFSILSGSTTTGTIIDMDADGTGLENTPVLSIAWLDKTDTFKIGCASVNDTFASPYGSSFIVKSRTVDTSTGFISNGYKTIGISLDNFSPKVIAAGAETSLYSFDSLWEETILDIEGIGEGLKPISIDTSYYGNGLKVVFSDNNGDIYYFENSSEIAYEISSPELTILTDENTKLAIYNKINIQGNTLPDSFNAFYGDILKDSEHRILISTMDIESTSSSTSSSSSSSSNSSSSSSSSSSESEGV